MAALLLSNSQPSYLSLGYAAWLGEGCRSQDPCLQPDKASCPWESQHLPSCHILFSSEKSMPWPQPRLLPGGRRKDSQADSPGSHQPPPLMLNRPPHLPQRAHPSHQRQKVLFLQLPEMSPPPPSHPGLMTGHPVALSHLMS